MPDLSHEPVRAITKAMQTGYKRRTPKRVNRGKFSEKTKREIFERDGYKCVRCGSHYIESVPHHIVYKSQGGRGTADNGATVCRTCHNLAHSHRDIREWFERYKERWL